MDDDKGGHNYDIVSYWEKIVADYVGISILDVEELDYIDYLLFRRDAFIYRMSRTEKGEEYLNNAYRLEQTKPDRKHLRQKFGKERVNG